MKDKISHSILLQVYPSSIVVAGEWWWPSLSATHDHVLSMDEEFKERAGQDNSRISCYEVGMKNQSGYLPFRTQVLYRPRQNDRHRVMFGTSLCRYHTSTYPHASDSANRRTNDAIFVASMSSSSCATEDPPSKGSSITFQLDVKSAVTQIHHAVIAWKSGEWSSGSGVVIDTWPRLKIIGFETDRRWDGEGNMVAARSLAESSSRPGSD
ncbi:hypothetical protein TNCV_754381 [Trichonephila clavipes]|nr:hypothetical protein TNCV_754381 [Trichonephila clavipes]